MFSAASPHVLPVDQRLEEPYSSSWTSEPLDDPLEILGYPRAVLHIAVTTDIATVVARLIDVAPDGAAALVTKGVLNLTHRDSHEEPTPVVPGEVYRIDLRLDATSWRFDPGHRIRLSLAGADFPNTWPSPKPYTALVHLGGRHSSCLLLPVIGPQELPLPDPELQAPADYDPMAQTWSEKPTWRVTRDHMAATTEVTLAKAGGARVGDEIAFETSSEAVATVSERDPARATIRGLSRVVLHWPGRTIDARARGQIESTESAFHVTLNLEITMGGFPHATRRWVRTYPRNLL
jgi:hypothetical protein